MNWIKQPTTTLIEKTILYRKERVKEMRFNHSRFCRKLLDKEKLNLDECISRMALHMAPPEGLEGMDRQLFDIVIIENNYCFESRALLGYHGKRLMNSLGFVVELVLKEKHHPNAIKAKISERYITTMLELSPLFTFQFRKIAYC